jgi:integrase
VVRKKAASGDVVAKRDLAILLFFLTTGMRRNEVMGLRGGDVERREDLLIIRSTVKGGDYVGREVRDRQVREALVDYLEASGRMKAWDVGGPLWTRHDRAGRPGAPSPAEVREGVRRLREDHDFFMRELAGAVNAARAGRAGRPGRRRAAAADQECSARRVRAARRAQPRRGRAGLPLAGGDAECRGARRVECRGEA